MINVSRPRLRPVLFVLMLGLVSARVGADVSDFFEGRPSIPTLVTSFAPSALLTAMLFIGTLALSREQGFGGIRLSRPEVTPRQILLLGAMAIAAVGVSYGAVTIVIQFGLLIGAPIVLAFSALFLIVFMSMLRIAYAIALFFAVWPLLSYIGVAIRGQSDDLLGRSILMLPTSTILDTADSLYERVESMNPEALFLGAIILVWLLSTLLRRHVRLRRTPLDIPIVIFLTAGFVSMLLSSDSALSFTWYLAGSVLPIGLYYVIVSSIRVRTDVIVVLTGMTAGLGIAAGVQLMRTLQAVLGSGGVSDAISAGLRWNPMFGNPQSTSQIFTYLVLAAPLALLAIAPVPRLVRALAVVVLLATMASLAVNVSRGALLGLAAGLLFFAFNTNVFRRLFIAVGLGMVMVSVLFIETIRSVMVQLRPSLAVPVFEEAGFANRLFYWRESLEIIKENPLFGIGVGTFPEQNVTVPGYGFQADDSHHLFLFIGSEMGLIVLGAFVAVLLVLVKQSVSVLRRHRNDPLRPMLVAWAAALVAFFVVGISAGDRFHYYPWGSAPGLIFWTVAALIVAARLGTWSSQGNSVGAGHDGPSESRTGPS